MDKYIISSKKSKDFKLKFEYISTLGNGSFGKVKLYRDRFLNEIKFAIKTMKKSEMNLNQINSFKNEIDILRKLDHPNIVKYYSFDGELLNEVSQPVNLKDEEKRIDPNAPRPQPVRSSIRYWPAISLGTVGTKGVPGFYIDFYDKHDNCFKSFRYHSDTKMIITLVRKDYEMVSYEERNYTIASDEEAQNLQYFPLDLSRCEMDMSIPTIPRASRRSFCNIL